MRHSRVHCCRYGLKLVGLGLATCSWHVGRSRTCVSQQTLNTGPAHVAAAEPDRSRNVHGVLLAFL